MPEAKPKAGRKKVGEGVGGWEGMGMGGRMGRGGVDEEWSR